MRIAKVNVYRVTLPFRGDVSHSRRRGASAENVVVEAVTDEGGVRGYGEGAPRPYVTGESQESAAQSARHLAEGQSFPWELNQVSQIWGFVDSLPDGKERNCAICALEMALLDALGKTQGRSLLHYFHSDFHTSTVHYGATIPLSTAEEVAQACRLSKTVGVSKVRLKVGKVFGQNRQAIEAARQTLGDDCDLRIDSNGSWDRQIAFEHVPLIQAYGISVVEQPMMPGDPDIGEFSKVMQAHGVILMADESVCSLGDLERVTRDGFYKMVNVRLSKCGGFRRSLNMIDRIRAADLSFQVGCQLGESGLLSAAGRALGLLCRDAVYYDGSYDRFLLNANTTSEHVSFGADGKAGPLDGPGLGVTVDRDSLTRLSSDSPSLTVVNPSS